MTRPVDRPGPAGAAGQVRALLGLRWQMVRTPGVRLAACVAVAAGVWLLALVVTGVAGVDPAALETAVELSPSVFLGFGVLAVVAPLAAGGGNEVVPPDQLVAFPLRPATHFLGGLVLAPANLVWVVQLVVVAVETAVLTLGGSLALGAVTAVAYVLCLTVSGQALAWTIGGLRATRRGRQAVTSAAVLLLLLAVGVVRVGAGDQVLAVSPTHAVVRAVVAGGARDLRAWAPTTLTLLAAAGFALVLGTRACAWSLSRPGDAGARRGRTVRRRRAHRSALRELVAVDRASVWRAPALRRGGLVLGVLPGLVAAGAQVPWESLVVLPGLVAAGAGLLFGVNAFCLDGQGAVWLASLPHDPRLAVRAKLVVLTETVLGAAVLAGATGSLRSPGTPTPAELSAVLAAGVACTAVVVAVCLRISLRAPHRADLAGSRDAVAPPGALALASARLALPTGLLGVLFTEAARSGRWEVPLLLAVPVLLAAGLSLRRTLARWDDPLARARVVQAVSAG